MKKVILLLGCLSSLGLADTLVTPQCRSSASAKTGCSFEEHKLADQIIETSMDGSRQEYFATDFKMSYRFDCKGHKTGLVFKSQSNQKTAAFTGAEDKILIIEEGFGDLYLTDNDVTATYQAVLIGACDVRVRTVQRSPSFSTIKYWNALAVGEDGRGGQKKILKTALEYLLLARNFDEVSSWNLGKLKLMQEKLSQLVRAFPTNPQYKVLLVTVEAAINGQPVPFEAAVVDGAAVSLVEIAQKGLDDELTRTQNLLYRFEKWSLQIDQDLQNTLNCIKEGNTQCL